MRWPTDARFVGDGPSLDILGAECVRKPSRDNVPFSYFSVLVVQLNSGNETHTVDFSGSFLCHEKTCGKTLAIAFCTPNAFEGANVIVI